MSVTVTQTTNTVTLSPVDGASVTVTAPASRSVAVSAAGVTGPSGITMFDIRDYGALASPDDIGPAVQDACDAMVAYGGGAVFVPPRADGVSRAWGWTTFVESTSTPSQSQSLRVVGVAAQTIVSVGVGQAKLLQLTDSNALIEISGFTVLGSQTAGVNCANVFHIAQARTGILTDCQFWGLDCDGTGYGVARVIADTVHIDDLLFHGCNYSGTRYEGACLSVTGARDSCRVWGVRFEVGGDGTFNGTTYNKSNQATNTHLWVGAQGDDGDPNGFGEIEIAQCYLQANARDQIVIQPVVGGIVDHARIRGCSFNGQSSLQGAPVVSKRCDQLVVEGCTFGNSAANQYAIAFEGERLIVRNSKGATGGKRIVFTGATTYVEVDECDGFTFDTSLGSTPLHGITRVNGTQTTVYP